MAIMPTTRKGRYDFYQRRYQRRRRRLHNRKRRLSGEPKHLYGRERDASGAAWQAPRRWPLKVAWQAFPRTFNYFVYIPPTVNPLRPPIWRLTETYIKYASQRVHKRVLGVHRRRMKVVKRLHNYPLVPYDSGPRFPPRPGPSYG